jgi:hypothetical protein
VNLKKHFRLEREGGGESISITNYGHLCEINLTHRTLDHV